MQTITMTKDGVPWRGRRWRIAGGAYTPAIDEVFPTEAAEIERAAERSAAEIAAARQKLLRSDGQPVYGPQEQADRARAIVEQAAAAFDAATARFAEQAEREQDKAERDLAILEGGGADPFDQLKPEEQARATSRQSFIREDCETLPVHRLAPLARAALAANDRGSVYLFHRYLERRLQAGGNRSEAAELGALVREVAAPFDDPQRGEKRRKLERRVEAAKSLRHRPDAARRQFDGRHDAMLVGMRQQVGRYF